MTGSLAPLSLIQFMPATRTEAVEVSFRALKSKRCIKFVVLFGAAQSVEVTP